MSTDQSATILKLKSGGTLRVRDDMEVRCDTHGIVTTWGALDPLNGTSVWYYFVDKKWEISNA